MQTSPTFLEIEQLTIRIFSFLPKWRKARYSGDAAFYGITRTAVKNMSFSWDHTMPAPAPRVDLFPHQQKALELCCMWLEQTPRFDFIYPANYILTPIGPIPSELRDKIVLATDPAKDDLRNRESWLRTVKRMDGR